MSPEHGIGSDMDSMSPRLVKRSNLTYHNHCTQAAGRRATRPRLQTWFQHECLRKVLGMLLPLIMEPIYRILGPLGPLSLTESVLSILPCGARSGWFFDICEILAQPSPSSRALSFPNVDAKNGVNTMCPGLGRMKPVVPTFDYVQAKKVAKMGSPPIRDKHG